MNKRSSFFDDIGKKVYIAAHRGTFGGNIPCNTLAAYDIALNQGADIIETDVFRTIDGELFVFHTGCESRHLGKDFDIRQLTASEVKKLRYCNIDGSKTQYSVNSLDECLEHLKGRCLINLDRCWDIWEYVVKAVERHNMSDQIIFKSAPKQKYLDKIEEVAPNYMYMPIITEEDTCSEIIEKMNINYIGVELVFSSEDMPVAQDEYIQTMKKKGKILWGNGIIFDYKRQLAAGHNDDISVVGKPDEGWGWLVKKGFDIIQTDWVGMLDDYLRKIGAR